MSWLALYELARTIEQRGEGQCYDPRHTRPGYISAEDDAKAQVVGVLIVVLLGALGGAAYWVHGLWKLWRWW